MWVMYSPVFLRTCALLVLSPRSVGIQSCNPDNEQYLNVLICLISPSFTSEAVLDGVPPLPLHGVVQSALVVVLAAQPGLTLQIIVLLYMRI